MALQFHHMEDWTIELAVTEKGRWPAHAACRVGPSSRLRKVT